MTISVKGEYALQALFDLASQPAADRERDAHQQQVEHAEAHAQVAVEAVDAGVDVPLFANDVDFDAAGWRMTFIDDSALGHDKAARVRAASAGARTVYVGDGISDFEGALAADVRFAKKGRALERYCRERGLECTSFSSFDEIATALWHRV